MYVYKIFREKAVEQKCDVLRKQIQSLSEQLAKQTQELTIVRTEHITKMGVLQSQLSQKIEEVKYTTIHLSSFIEQNMVVKIFIWKS